MRFKSLLFLTVFSVTCSVGFSQAQEKMTTEKKAVLTKSTKLTTANQPKSQVALNNPDGYMGKKEQILKNLIVDEIPADFPKYKNGLSAEEYKMLIQKWGKNNQNLFTEEYKQKRAAKNSRNK